MKVKGLDGRIYTINILGKVPCANDECNRSGLHIEARKLLNVTFPLDRVYEEIYLPGSDGLTVDFFVPACKLMVEVQGEQHYKFIPFFHVTKLAFIESQKRDRRKKAWAELNNFQLIEFIYNETVEQWKAKLAIN